MQHGGTQNAAPHTTALRHAGGAPFFHPARDRVQAHRGPRDIDIEIASLSVAGDAFILNP
ncbi:hypothetical protein DIE14_06320 [Burkholderia sp. Bp9017]|nr:hypothetical protein DIE14_06320 [Burkholderia sp. Bp9017]RQZ37088.1 hypothetical protein DIE13_02915 [Burkholderia sp. Bp9016]